MLRHFIQWLIGAKVRLEAEIDEAFSHGACLDCCRGRKVKVMYNFQTGYYQEYCIDCNEFSLV